MATAAGLNTNLVRLQTAVLCANCDVISEGLNGRCVSCGSQSLLSLSRVLGRTIEAEPLLPKTTSTLANSADENIYALVAAA